jgi:hypothetical protein
LVCGSFFLIYPLAPEVVNTELYLRELSVLAITTPYLILGKKKKTKKKFVIEIMQ